MRIGDTADAQMIKDCRFEFNAFLDNPDPKAFFQNNNMWLNKIIIEEVRTFLIFYILTNVQAKLRATRDSATIRALRNELRCQKIDATLLDQLKKSCVCLANLTRTLLPFVSPKKGHRIDIPSESEAEEGEEELDDDEDDSDDDRDDEDSEEEEDNVDGSSEDDSHEDQGDECENSTAVANVPHTTAAFTRKRKTEQ